MEKRRLGASGLEVSVFSFGAMTFGEGGGFFKAVGDTHGNDATRLVDLCIDAGVNLFDTADVYSRGVSEEVLGKALGNRRKDVLVATKVFGRMSDGFDDIGLGRRHIIAACEASLRRLGTDWIDLYQAHSFDGLVPLDETLRAFEDLVRSGKVRYIGCSNYSAWQLAKADGISRRLGLTRYIGQQIQYSLMVRDVEHEMLPAGVDLGIGALIWSPLAWGYLTGKFRDAGEPAAPTRLAQMGGIAAYDDERGRRVVDLLREIAGAHEGASPAQVALNWVRARPGVSSILIGARNEAQLLDNLAAAQWELSAEEVRRLDAASALPLPYPASHREIYALERNPPLFPRATDPA